MSPVTPTAVVQPNRYRVPVPFPSFGRSRTDLKAVGTSTGRHRTVGQQVEDTLPDHELESYLAALSPDADTDAETTGSGRRFGSAEVFQLRLSLMATEQLRELAAYRQTSPMALAQEWVMQRLEWEAQQLQRR
ncbi:hypothetical protein Aglo01_12450 [Actinokineospora globicatena]|uniref:Uncharacterized protein n=1 Tax=Actinokineospora globicatena TaxID=103729 RepID=A0A9W6QPK4_9PSEU|nr:hypothetical protein Aglo01_12450 [Actinokineospora globicatena]GLW83596.1 hypothetical protein Aglo02_12360 [Actinokineospora globicatena]GLW92455.1 hypothetical protein Aglo03_32710 [Actinokineospora globicatena]